MVHAASRSVILFAECCDAARGQRPIQARVGEQADDLYLHGFDALSIEAGVEPVDFPRYLALDAYPTAA